MFPVNRAQLLVIWTVGLLVALILLYQGLGEPYLERRECRARRIAMSGPILKAFNSNPAAIDNAQALDIVNQVVKAASEVEQSCLAQGNTKSNYVVGAIIPTILLGVCAFVSVGNRRPVRDSSTPETSE